MNKVQILGTMTRDVELKHTQSGMAIGNFGVAQNEKVKQQDGSYQDKALFFDVTAFGKTAEAINTFFRKGSRILIDGSLDFQQWKAQDGTNRSKVSIKLRGFDFIDKKEDNQAPSNNNQANYQQPQPQQGGYNQPPSNNGQANYAPPQQTQQQQYNQQKDYP